MSKPSGKADRPRRRPKFDDAAVQVMRLHRRRHELQFVFPTTSRSASEASISKEGLL